MKRFYIFVAVFFGCGLFSVNAADMIILKDGNIIEAKIMEMHPGEIRYKRADNLNGPMVFLPKAGVLSIKYDNGVVEIVNAPPPAAAPRAQTASSPAAPPPAQTVSLPPAGQQSGQAGGVISSVAQQLGVPSSLQEILNALPAIKIAGNNLKFLFNGGDWTATVNGENFWAGTVELEDTDGGSILNLKQTHMWPGAVGKAAGRLASKVGGGAVGGTLNTAGNIAGKAGPVEVSGTAIVLEYKAGPPAKLSYLRTAKAPSAGSPDAESEYIALTDAQWSTITYVQNSSKGNKPSATFNIAGEQIGGQVREVLTLKVISTRVGGLTFGGIILKDQTMIQQLQSGDGVRFKVFGDGKPWVIRIPTTETTSGLCFYQTNIATKKGKIVEIDIPYQILRPAEGNKVSFKKDEITGLHLLRFCSDETRGSTIKIFDFEIY